MEQKITIMESNFNEYYGLVEWVSDNLDVLKQTGLKLIKDSVHMVYNGFVVKNEILEQTFFVKCDKEKSDEYDLGCILVECALQKTQGVIWLTSNIKSDVRKTFEWFGNSMGPDFETYLIDIEVK